MKNLAKLVLFLIFSLVLVSCGGETGFSGPAVIEQSDYFDGSVYHRYYRINDAGDIGYATSTDGVKFNNYDNNPVLTGSVFPVLVNDNGVPRLIVQRGSGSGKYYLYNINNSWTTPILANGGDPILVPGTVNWGGQMFNVGVAIVGNRWHMLIEGKPGGVFSLGYSYADFENGHLNFNEHLSSEIIVHDAGNPSLTYFPERNSILALYGWGLASTDFWSIKASTISLNNNLSLASSWKRSNFNISKPGIHMADVDLGFGSNDSSLIISVGYAQIAVDTYYYFGTKLKLFDDIFNNVDTKLMEDKTNPTMTAEE